MKSCYCPNCGRLQTFKLDVLGRVMGHCPKCARSLLFKRNSGGMSVNVQNPKGA